MKTQTDSTDQAHSPITQGLIQEPAFLNLLKQFLSYTPAGMLQRTDAAGTQRAMEEAPDVLQALLTPVGNAQQTQQVMEGLATKATQRALSKAIGDHATEAYNQGVPISHIQDHAQTMDMPSQLSGLPTDQSQLANTQPFQQASPSAGGSPPPTPSAGNAPLPFNATPQQVMTNLAGTVRRPQSFGESLWQPIGPNAQGQYQTGGLLNRMLEGASTAMGQPSTLQELGGIQQLAQQTPEQRLQAAQTQMFTNPGAMKYVQTYAEQMATKAVQQNTPLTPNEQSTILKGEIDPTVGTGPLGALTGKLNPLAAQAHNAILYKSTLVNQPWESVAGFIKQKMRDKFISPEQGKQVYNELMSRINPHASTK